MVKTKKKTKPASDLETKIYNESLSRGKKIYIGKIRRSKPCHTNFKKIKRPADSWSKEKTTVRAAKLQCKKCSILSRAK